MAQGWIAKQIADGKRDSQIINELLRTGWKETDAKQAIAEARKTQPIAYRLPTAYTMAFASALAGIFALALYVTANNRQLDNYMNAFEYALDVSIESAIITISLFVLAWVAYEIAIKHHHPKEHRAFFAIAAGIMGAGAAAWFIFLMILLLRWTQAIVLTAVALIILAIAFGILVAVLEATYMTLRSHYDDRPRSSTRRMLAISGICAIVVLALLLAVAAVVENNTVHDSYDNVMHIHSDVNGRMEDVRNNIDAIDNAYLRKELLLRFEPLDIDAPATVTLKSVMTEEPLRQWADHILMIQSRWYDISAVGRLSTAYPAFLTDIDAAHNYDLTLYNALREPDYDGAARSESSLGLNVLTDTKFLGLRWSVIEYLKSQSAAMRDKNARARAYTDFFPANPDMSDPEQAELVAFRIWLHEQEMTTQEE